MQTIIGAGQTATGLVAGAGDIVAVNNSDGTGIFGYSGGPPGGAVFQTTLNGGGLIVSIGSADQTAVNSGSEMTIYAEGLATNTNLTGGRLYVQLGAKAEHTVIGTGGALSGDGSTQDTIINDGGSYSIGPLFTSHNGIFVNSGGTLSFQDTYSTYSDLHLASGGRIQLPIPAAENTATFDASSNNLVVSYKYFSYDSSGPVAQIGTYSLHLTGDYSTANFVLSAAGATSGTVGAALVTAQNVCFCLGTRIQTPQGEAPIESLQVSDLVLTAGGASRTIRWIGSGASLVHKENRPVVIRAHAFPDGSPRRDLRVTRGHSFLFGDVLIPIEHLINGNSIAWDTTARTVEVFHIELDSHDILLAEGARAESYRDDGNRSSFVSSTGEQRPSRSMPTFAPLVTSGPIVERTRARLATRAETLAIAGKETRVA
jgi:hypothetical protein